MEQDQREKSEYCLNSLIKRGEKGIGYVFTLVGRDKTG